MQTGIRGTPAQTLDGGLTMGRYDWHSSVSAVEEDTILVRGYPLTELIEHLSFSDAAYLVLRGEMPDAASSRLFGACLTAILDYAVGPAPFAARVVASANPQLGPAMAAGILAQGAFAVSPQETGELLKSALSQVDVGSPEEIVAADVVKQYRGAGRRIPGLGHPSTHSADGRAAALAKVMRETRKWGRAASMYGAIREQWERETSKALEVNVDGMLATALSELGFEPIEMGGVAALSMLPGIIANTVEEMKSGVRIRQIQDLQYTGAPRRHVDTGARRDG